MGYETKNSKNGQPSTVGHFMMAACKKRVLSTLFAFSFFCLLVTLLLSHTSAFPPRSIPARGDTLIESAIADDPTSPPTTEHQCQFCWKKFDSRNALFRHLKTDQRCSSEFPNFRDKTAGNDDSPSRNFTRKQSLLLKISYSLQNQRNSANASSGDSSNPKASVFCWKKGCENTSDAYEIGQKVQEAVEIGLLDIFGGPKSEATIDDTQNRAHSSGPGLIVGTTQTSAANHRPSVLAQENGISSAADFLLANVQMPQGEREDSSEVDNLIAASRKFLGDDVETSSGAVYNLKILNGMRLPKDFAFHAEKDCTQRVYHYLLPLSWLPDGSLLESWCQNYDDRSKPAPPSDALARLRETLQLAESTSIPNRKVRRRQRSATNDSDVMATPNQSVMKKIRKASASLNRKERMPWHNFGHVELRGDASPNQEPVWNVLDKARIKGFLLPSGFDPADETIAVLEFRGDNFVPGQIQSIVGTAVAVLHGWLPSDIFSIALSKDFVLETPSSPKHRLYCAGARFHSHESKLVTVMQEEEEKAQTFDVLEYGHPKTALQATQEQMLQRLRSFEVSGTKNDKKWLEELEHSVSPRIKKAIVRLKEQNVVASGSSSVVADSLPTLEACVQEQWVTAASMTQDDTALVPAYDRTLHLLREIVATGSWPETSMARSNVIREEDTASSRIESADSESNGRNCGSFTVFNMQVTGNPLLESMTPTQESPDNKEQMDASQNSLPLGNQKFPDLVEAVFELERVLSESGMLRQRACLDGSLTEQNQEESARPPSLCCAINANASFLPHVDSGRGSGQSLSLIVGLGDYDNGGEIRVEDFSHDIRYKPLEFDGWLSRHWTQPYRGERFSLVWFSPAT